MGNETSPEGLDEDWGDDWELAGEELPRDSEEFEATVAPELDPAPPLAGLQGAHEVHVFRKAPLWAEGFVGSVRLGEGDELDLSELKRMWGGGTYQLRPRQNKGRGMQYVPGAVRLSFTGPPMENGQVLDRGTGQPVIDVPASSLGGYEQRGAVPVRVGPGNGLDMMGGLFGQLLDRMDRLEARIAQPAAVPVPVDPLAEVRKAAGLVRELQGLAGMVLGNVPEDDDEDDEDDEEAEGPPGIEGLLLKALEKRLVADEAKPETTEAPKPRPRLIRSPSKPAAPPQQAPPVEAPPQPQPAPPDLVAEETPEHDAWAGTVEPELRRSDEGSRAEQLANDLRSLSPEEQLKIAQESIEALPTDQVRAAFEAMQRERVADA